MTDFGSLQGRRILVYGPVGELVTAVASTCAAAGSEVLIIDPSKVGEEQIGAHLAQLAGAGKFNGFVFVLKLPEICPLSELSVAEERAAVEQGLVSLIAAIQVLQKKKVSEKCSVVVVSSVRSQVGASGTVLQAIAAGALSTAVRTLAVELAPRQMRVNAVLPPVVLSVGDEVRLAESVRFLLSDASALINGTNMVSDGGFLQH